MCVILVDSHVTCGVCVSSSLIPRPHGRRKQPGNETTRFTLASFHNQYNCKYTMNGESMVRMSAGLSW